MPSFKLKSDVKDFVIANKSRIKEEGFAKAEEFEKYFDSEEIARQ